MCVRNGDCGSVLSFVFFFKQKTAYEMRISDWSSDVCSSDLGPPFLATGGDAGTDLPAAHPEAQRLLGRAGLRAGAAARPRSRRRHLPPGHLPALARPG